MRLSAAAAIVTLGCTAANIIPKGEDVVNFGHESFIDSVYGELLSADARDFKHKLLASGQISHYTAPLPHAYSLADLLGTQDFLTLHEMQERSRKTKMAAKLHQGYMRYKSKIDYPNDDDTSDLSNESLFGGIVTFGHFKHLNCFNPSESPESIDIAIVGAPFDTGVTYRPGARFGPEAIRLTLRRLGQGFTPVRGNGKPGSKLSHVDPYATNLSIIDCGDVPMTPFDNRIALNQLYRGQRAIHSHTPTIDGNNSPKIITMGGDHTITLMTLRSAYEKYGPLTVLHFDSHIDTWDPKVLGGGITEYMSLNHGTFLHYAAESGFLNTLTCMHVGLRAPYVSPKYDIDHDHECGFETITARDLDNLGRDAVIQKIKQRIGDLSQPVYISVDIDVLDPAAAPGTGTLEVGGWTTRELLSVLDGLEGINLVGADVVEVSPPYDTNAEITSLAATAVIDAFLGLMVVYDED